MLAELDRIAERGGVLGAMETGYQRGRIQDESMLYEHRKHDGTLPIIGVNTFLDPNADARSTRGDRAGPLRRRREAGPARPAAPASSAAHADDVRAALERLRQAALDGDNMFAVLMDAVRSLQPRPDHRHAVRRRRPLPPQRLTHSIRRQTSEEEPWPHWGWKTWSSCASSCAIRTASS